MPDAMAPQRMVPALIMNTLLYRFPNMPTKGTKTACKHAIPIHTIFQDDYKVHYKAHAPLTLTSLV